MCCQVEGFALGRSLVQRIPTECGVSLSVITCDTNPLHSQWIGRRHKNMQDRTKWIPLHAKQNTQLRLPANRAIFKLPCKNCNEHFAPTFSWTSHFQIWRHRMASKITRFIGVWFLPVGPPYECGVFCTITSHNSRTEAADTGRDFKNPGRRVT